MQDDSLLLDASLERAAETLGDITQPVMDRFYETCPEAKAAFAHHGLGDPGKLEALMVENVLHLLMNWLDRTEQLRIELRDSVPHHDETLKVPPGWYRDLVQAAVEVIAGTLPADASAERALWDRMGRELGETIEASAVHVEPQAAA